MGQQRLKLTLCTAASQRGAAANNSNSSRSHSLISHGSGPAPLPQPPPRRPQRVLRVLRAQLRALLEVLLAGHRDLVERLGGRMTVEEDRGGGRSWQGGCVRKRKRSG